jgi:GMP reductase
MDKLLNESQVYYDFDDVMIRPCLSNLTSRSQVNLEKKFFFNTKVNGTLNVIEWTGIPIIAANMDTTGTFEVYNVLSKYKMLTALHKFYTLEDFKKVMTEGNIKLDPNYFMISTGISDENYNKMVEIVEFTGCKWICIDVANGYMTALIDFVKKVRHCFPDRIIVAGNVVTSDMVKFLIDAGANIAKIGIGPGSACLTRLKTGVGCPQLSCIIDCRKAGFIISDGGIKNPCDLTKAFAAGADFVMMGGVFSGHDENPGDIYHDNNGTYKLFYGMSSKHAMDKHYGGMANYRASEGTVLKIKYKGALENSIQDFLGGLRSACTYTNSSNLDEFYDNSTFIRLK